MLAALHILSTVTIEATLPEARAPQNPPLVAIGVDHRDQEWCSRLALTDASLHQLLADLTADPGFAESAVLATCNRVEVYAVPSATPQPLPPVAQLSKRLLQAAALDPSLQPPLAHYDGGAAARRLARVACGLESMVLGETEILGQVADAAEAAHEASSIGPTLRLLFQHAVRAGKRARGETAISRHALSVGALAVNHAESLVPDLATERLAVIGTGLGARLVLSALKTRNAAQVSVVSRDLARARAEAHSWGADAYSWADLGTVLAGTRVAFCATDGDGVVDATAVIAATSDRSDHADLVLVDLGAPPNVAAGALNLPGVVVRRLADLGEESERALSLRRKEVPGVEAIVTAECEAFLTAHLELRAHPVIAALRLRADEVRERELERALREVNGAGGGELVRRQLEKLSRSIINQLLHEPTTRLRAAAENGNWDEHARVVRNLFDLEHPQSE